VKLYIETIGTESERFFSVLQEAMMAFARLTRIEGDVRANTAAIADLQTEQIALRADIAALQAAPGGTDNTAQLANLDTRLGEVEAELEKLTDTPPTEPPTGPTPPPGPTMTATAARRY
jgi:hypothetical protein